MLNRKGYLAMSMFNHIKKHLTVNLAAEAVMVAFAGLSLANVEAFFHVIHPHGIASWIGGLALGSILVIMAGLLGRMEVNFRSRGYLTVLSVTAGLALVSGLIQGAAYSNTLQWVPAYALGLALPLFGELGLALAVGEYVAAEKRRRLALADEMIEERINTAVDSALADIDMSSAKADVEDAARRIVKSKLDTLLARRVGNAQNAPNHPHLSEMTKDDSTEGTTMRTQRTSSTSGLDAVNAERQQKMAERRDSIVRLLINFGPMSVRDLRDALAEDCNIIVSDKTGRKDLGVLADAGRVTEADGVWSATMQPTAVEFSTNGVAHHD